MARLLPRFRRTGGSADTAAPPPGPPRRSLPHPSQLRRERRGLLRAREERLRDLGGLMMEMFRRDQFRQDLLVERCEELVAVDERLRELDTLLAVTVSARRAAPAARCECGAPLVWGSHFCANCGRPTSGTRPVVACKHCGTALAAEARFCAVCGHAVSVDQQSAAAAVEPPPEVLEALPASALDRWEE